MAFIINIFNTILNYVCFWNFIRFLMKFMLIFYKTAFYTAVEKGNIEMIKILLSSDKIDANILNILNAILFNKISTQMFQ